jgi:protein SCO1/2
MTAASPSRLWLFAVAALAATAVGILAAKHFVATRQPPPEIGGYVLPDPRVLPAVELVDAAGERFTPADFVGHWSLLYFGYTYCPDVCPLALIELAAVRKLLEAGPGTPAAAEYYLVSVDPARDTPERLREYVAYFDPSFHGLTGTPDDLRRLAEATGSLFLIQPGQGADNYLVSHSSNVTILDPAGRLAAVITPPHDPSGIAADFAKIVAYRAGRP